MTSATRKYFAAKNKQRGIRLRMMQHYNVTNNFGVDPMFVGPVIARGFAFRKNHCRTYVLPWQRRFKNTDALKQHLAKTAGKFVVEYVNPADCDR